MPTPLQRRNELGRELANSENRGSLNAPCDWGNSDSRDLWAFAHGAPLVLKSGGKFSIRTAMQNTTTARYAVRTRQFTWRVLVRPSLSTKRGQSGC
jgi:hypothetical protein